MVSGRIRRIGLGFEAKVESAQSAAVELLGPIIWIVLQVLQVFPGRIDEKRKA